MINKLNQNMPDQHQMKKMGRNFQNDAFGKGEKTLNFTTKTLQRSSIHQRKQKNRCRQNRIKLLKERCTTNDHFTTTRKKAQRLGDQIRNKNITLFPLMNKETHGTGFSLTTELSKTTARIITICGSETAN